MLDKISRHFDDAVNTLMCCFRWIFFRSSAMPTSTPASKKQSLQDAIEAPEDEAVTEVELGELVHRPDGYYWLDADGRQELGPFATMEEALAEVDVSDADESEPGESLEEAEDEIGIADWIDPDTGEPAEGLSTPRLHDE